MATINASHGVKVEAAIGASQSFVVSLTGILKRTLKWAAPDGAVLRYGVQWTRGQHHDPERPTSYIGNATKINVRNLPGFPSGTARFSFGVTAYGRNGRRIGEPGVLENVRVL